MSSSVFLRGEWRNLVLINYQCDPSILTKYLPPHTELDTYNGVHYISLVGFLFKDTKVRGVIVPFHRTFEEINLRFYVRHLDANDKWKRGVVFIKEIVPKKLISLVANKIFGENYETYETRHQWSSPTEERLSVEYMWKQANGWNWVAASADSVSYFPTPQSEENFICEHFWGYTKGKNGDTTEYNVEHPSWRIHKVRHYDINCDFEKTYGKDFASLTTARPISVFLADGSEIQVKNKRKIELVA
ncbi:MAG TPA: DUF2071 domain-containing protein [Bacteroidia bacterium]|jgi:uncharacterized protein YqjF (DUF2071 family)|nr:DUF2071 domain-containing protein [Bacteroidia bacterium]